MKLFYMSRFQDIFVAQILGNLLGKQYIGMVNFSFDYKIPISIWLNNDGIVNAQYKDSMGVGPLYEIIWQTKGKVGMYPKVPPPPVPPINNLEFVETAITKLLPPLPFSCPILEYSHLQRDRIRPDWDNIFSAHGRALLQSIPLVPLEGVALTKLHAIADDAAFWPTLLYLCMDGQLLCNYGPTLGRILKTFEQDLLARLTKLFGARAITPFTNAVQEALQDVWPERVNNKPSDPLYGTMPYCLCANMLKTKVSTVGMPTLANRCFDQALDKLPTNDAEVLHYLVTT